MLYVRLVHTHKIWQFFASHPVIHRHCRRSYSLLSLLAIPKYLELHVRRLLPKLSHLCDPQGLGVCVTGLQCRRYTRRKNPVQWLVAYTSAHRNSFTHEKISQQQYSTFGNDLSSFLQTNSNFKDSGLRVYVEWAGCNGHTGQYLYTVYQNAEDTWGAVMKPCMTWNPLQMEWGTPVGHGVWQSSFSLVSHRSSKGHDMKSSHHRL